MNCESFLDGRVTLHAGDSREVVRELADNSIDSVVTDPPYHLTSMSRPRPDLAGKDNQFARRQAQMSAGFMGKEWDGGDIAFRPELWAEIYRVLKPGAHLVAFGGTRTYHRLACAIEDAGFEIRDQLAWVYGSGFPKSHSISVAIDKINGAAPRGKAFNMKGRGERADELDGNGREFLPAYEPASEAACQWQGWGTALKPAWEPIVLARKPLSEPTIAANVLRWGPGGLNIEECRVGTDGGCAGAGAGAGAVVFSDGLNGTYAPRIPGLGRWPANLVHDGSEEVLAGFPDRDSGMYVGRNRDGDTKPGGYDGGWNKDTRDVGYADSGSAARFFASFPTEHKPCSSTNNANDAESLFDLKNERAVSALSRAVAASTARLALDCQSYRGRDTNVSAQQFEQVETLLTATILSIERRCSRGSRPEELFLTGSLASIAAVPKRIGITTITISLSTSNGFAEAATFDCIETSAEVGASGSAKRFHYTAKADADDRLGSKHPTIKPVNLMQWLLRLITPPQGVILDPFAGTGTTGEAAFREGFKAILIEREAEYQADIRRRMALCLAGPGERSRESTKARHGDKPQDHGPLFAEAAE